MQLSTRVQGGVRGHAYAQPEGLLGESMIRSSRKLGETSAFGQSLNEMGEALKQMAEIKFSLEDNVKQNFLDPLAHLQNKEIKDVNVSFRRIRVHHDYLFLTFFFPLSFIAKNLNHGDWTLIARNVVDQLPKQNKTIWSWPNLSSNKVWTWPLLECTGCCRIKQSTSINCARWPKLCKSITHSVPWFWKDSLLVWLNSESEAIMPKMVILFHRFLFFHSTAKKRRLRYRWKFTLQRTWRIWRLRPTLKNRIHHPANRAMVNLIKKTVCYHLSIIILLLCIL